MSRTCSERATTTFAPLDAKSSAVAAPIAIRLPGLYSDRWSQYHTASSTGAAA